MSDGVFNKMQKMAWHAEQIEMSHIDTFAFHDNILRIERADEPGDSRHASLGLPVDFDVRSLLACRGEQ
jgi:hypothetical protein